MKQRLGSEAASLTEINNGMAGMVKPSIKKSTRLREDMPLRGVFTVENQMLQLFDFGRKPFSLKWPHERTSSKKSFKRKGAKEKTTLLGVPYQRGLLFLVFFI